MISVLELREKRGQYCEHCNFRQGTQRHHIFFRRKKGEDYFDDERNLILACNTCHIEKGLLDGYKMKCVFWTRQVARYGLKSMLEYWHDAPIKGTKEKFW